MQVFVHRDGRNLGPYSPAQLRSYLETGNFSEEDMACHDGRNWIQLSEVPGLLDHPGKTIPRAVREKQGDPKTEAGSRKKPYLLLALALLVVSMAVLSGYLLLKGEKPAEPVDLLDIKPEQVVEVYDGDTFKVQLEGVHPLFGEKLPIRVKGIDTPELRGTSKEVKSLAVQARDLTKSALKGAQRIELRNPERGKYFRIVADVWVDGKALAGILKDKGLAKNYDGEGERPEW